MQEGLAGMGAPKAPQPQEQAQPQGQAQLQLQQVMQMLMQGISPEELIAQGIPASAIEQAIAMLEKQATEQQPMEGPEGLAGRQITGAM